MLGKSRSFLKKKRANCRGTVKVEEKAEAGELSIPFPRKISILNLEKMLIDEIGPVGGKLHTGRSRNDQVATDMHLYLKKQVEGYHGIN